MRGLCLDYVMQVIKVWHFTNIGLPLAAFVDFPGYCN